MRGQEVGVSVLEGKGEGDKRLGCQSGRAKVSGGRGGGWGVGLGGQR